MQLFFIDLLLKTTACFIIASYCELRDQVAWQKNQNNELKDAKGGRSDQNFVYTATSDLFHIAQRLLFI